MAIKRDYYEVLGVPRDASDEEIKRAFRKAAQRHHPDVDTSDGAEHRFKELNEAYRILSDRQRRTAYDMFGHAGVDGTSGGGFEGFGGGFGPFGDIFDAFFGGPPAGTRQRRRVVAGADLRYDLTIDFAEAVAGVTKEVTFPTLVTCDVCDHSFQFGPHVYDGRKNQTYDIMVCRGCHSANWDGWAPQLEEKVTHNVVAKGLLPPKRNENGRLPRE